MPESSVMLALMISFAYMVLGVRIMFNNVCSSNNKHLSFNLFCRVCLKKFKSCLINFIKLIGVPHYACVNKDVISVGGVVFLHGYSIYASIFYFVIHFLKV